MKARTDEIASVIREEISRYREQLSRRGALRLLSGDMAEAIHEEVARRSSEVEVAHVGRVLEVGDGIAQVYGLSDAMAGEMLQFENGQMGQVFNLEESSVGAVIYGSCEQIKAGQGVRGTGRLLDVPVGQAMLGRVVDALGRPIDGAGPISTAQSRPLEMPAPGITERQPVTEPLLTGIKAIDSMTPIGRGQRELIIGDRKTGKTAIAVDTIINHAGGDVLCVYVAIGQKESTVAGVVDTLREHGAMNHCIVVSASGGTAAPLQYIAPYAGCTIAEYFMYEQGRATLVVYDDLTKQATAYREISLLLRRPPGREAYPGDVFYLHSRLLERACKLADRYVIVPQQTPEDFLDVDPHRKVYVGPLGRKQAARDLAAMEDAAGNKVHRLPSSGGSMTALPICETQEGEVSAYIPTNLISITDGQIYLEPGLFYSGVRPAINAGISVSRVGYKAACKAMKKVASSLRLDLASYRELAAYTQVSMAVDAATQQRLDRGERLVRLLTQPQYQPRAIVDQVVAIYAGTRGYLDEIEPDRVAEFEAGLLKTIRTQNADFREDLAAAADLTDDRERKLQRILTAYKEKFQAGVGQAIPPMPPVSERPT
ncbi:MAG: F0F1 ATP synthase subunit alpha [Phycisphaerae bacterium]